MLAAIFDGFDVDLLSLIEMAEKLDPLYVCPCSTALHTSAFLSDPTNPQPPPPQSQ